MTREEKLSLVEELKTKFEGQDYFYITDASTLKVEQVNKLREICFQKEVSMQVIKNTLVKKALEQIADDGRYDELYATLKGPTAVFFTEVSNTPAKIIKKFREEHCC